MKLYGKLREFAEHNEWDFKDGLWGTPCISGEYRGYQFKFDFGILNSGFSSRANQRRIKLTLFIRNPENVDFKLRGGLLTNFGYRGLQTGEKPFDQQFVLIGKPEILILKLFEDSILRKQLKKIKLRIGNISVKVSEHILYCEPQFYAPVGRISWRSVEETVMEVLDVMSDLADNINNLDGD